MSTPTYFFLYFWLVSFISQTDCDYEPVYPRCDYTVIDRIKQVWEDNGLPINVAKQLNKGYILMFTSFDFPGDPKWVLVNSTTDANSNSALVVMTYIINVCGCGSSYSTYNITESKGVMTGQDGFTLYNLYSSNGVLLNYICNCKEEKEGPPAGNILIASDSWYADCTKNTASSVKRIAEFVGFNLTHEYGNENY